MASVTAGQRSNIKIVIIESYKPDTTFKDNSVMTHSDPSFSQMPVECMLMEIRSTLWDTSYIVEFQWFKTHFIGGVSYPEIAGQIGFTCGDHVEDRVHDMLDDAVYRMPEWLATKCLGIYTVFFRENEIKVPQQRAKRGPRLPHLTFPQRRCNVNGDNIR